MHRDFKGGNVIVTDRDPEVPRIVDFGLAMLTELDNEDRITTDGLVFGTPMYMSPEQVTGREIDHLTDLFALGIVIYEMLAGVGPFEGPAMSLARQNLSAVPPPIAQRVPNLLVDSDLEAIAQVLMKKKSADRYQSAAAVIAALDGLPAEGRLPGGIVEVKPTTVNVPASIAAEPPATDQPSITSDLSEPIERQRPVALWVIAALGALIALIALGVMLRRSGAKSDAAAMATPDAEPTERPETELAVRNLDQPDASLAGATSTGWDAAPQPREVKVPVEKTPVEKASIENAPIGDDPIVVTKKVEPDAGAQRPIETPPKIIETKTLTALYTEVQKEITGLQTDKGKGAAASFWKRWDEVTPLSDALQKEPLRAQAFGQLRGLLRDLKAARGQP